MKKNIFKKLFAAFLVVFHLAAGEDFRLDGQAEPSTYIHGCVNAVTGGFVYSFPDIIVEGPEPLSFIRHYCDHNDSVSEFGKGFTHNHPVNMYEPTWLQSSYRGLSIEEANGDRVYYIGNIEKKKKKENYWFYLDPAQLKHGITNCSGGEISGRTNLKNTKLCVKKEDAGKWRRGTCIAYLGDGTKRHYTVESHMTHEVRPSGNIVHYKYDKKNRITRIYATDSSGNTQLGSIRFSYDKNHSVRVEASNGKKGTYTLSKHKDDYYVDPTYILDRCSVTGMPRCTFAYKTKKIKNCKFWMMKELDWNEGGKIGLEYTDDRKVSGIYLPGAGSQSVKVYTISYHPKKKYTSVKDIEGGKTVYSYSSNMQLKEKERHHQGTLYSAQLFFWGEKTKKHKKGEPLEGEDGNLIAKGIADAGKNLLSLTTYTYDSFGNVLTETIAGDLTGALRPSPIKMLEDNKPDLKRKEVYRRHYTYSDNGYNLPLSMREDDGTGWTCRYLPNSDKPVEKLFYAGKRIVGREFFEYNTLRILVKKIVDDGTVKNAADMQGVTQRLITVIQPNKASGTPGFGKPMRLIEKYWDPRTGNERQLKRVDYKYGQYDLVTSEAHYDADNTLRYTLTYKYDGAGNCIEESDPLGRVTKYRYNASNLCTFKEQCSSGCSTHYTYDSRGRLAQTEEKHQSGEHFVQKIHYDHLDRKIAEIDHFGNKTTYQYDDMGRLIQTTGPAFAGENGKMITPIDCKAYNIWDQVIVEENPCGDKVRKTYTCRGQVKRLTYPDGTKEQYRYNLNGTLRKKVHKNGTYALMSYDGQNNLIQEDTCSAEGSVLRSLTFQYEGKHLVAAIDAMGQVTKYVYDGAGRKTAQIRHGDGKTYCEEYGYDTLGRLACTKSWSGDDAYIQYITEYDTADRVIEKRIEDHYGNICSRQCYAHDSNDNCIEEITYQGDNKPSATSTSYTSYHLPAKKTDALGHTTHFAYDFKHVNPHGQHVLKVTATDPKGTQTLTVKDTHGRDAMIKIYTAHGILLASEKLFYDARGLKVSQVADAIAAGETIQKYCVAWFYDKMGRPISIVEDPANKNKRATMTYTSLGALETKTKPDGIVLTYQYDMLGREIAVKASDGSLSYTYAYDLNDHLIESRDKLTDATLTREYNAFGNLIAEIFPNGYSLTYDYDRQQRVTTLRLPDGSHIAYDYGPIYMRTVKKISSKNHLQYSHSYDEVDWQGRSLTSTLITGEKIHFGWDFLGRLTSMETSYVKESIPEGGYDPLGNLLTVSFISTWGSQTEQYRYDDLNQLIREDGVAIHNYHHDSLHNRLAKDQSAYTLNTLNQVEDAEGVAYSYDLNGNLIKDDNLCYVYDALNRLKSISKEREWRIECAYDSFGRRVSTTHFMWKDDWEEENISHFLYQGLNEIGSLDEEGNICQLRIMGKREEMAAAVAMELHGHVYVPIYDHRYNLICLLDSVSNQPVETYRYTSFGSVFFYDGSGRQQNTSAIGTPWLFSSKRYDRLSGLYNFCKRDYSPSLGRWITPDPGDFIDGLNLYAYTHNTPMTCIDFFGFQTDEISKGTQDKAHALLALYHLMNAGAHCAGRGIEQVGHHIFPIGSLQYCCEGIGRSLQGKSFHHTASWNLPSASGVVGEKAFSRALVRLVPGILTTWEQAESGAARMSSCLDGYKVHFTCHQTQGFAMDSKKAAFASVSDEAIVHLQNRMIRDYLSMKKRCGDNFNIYYVPYSRGGKEAYQAAFGLPPEIRNKISVYTLGSLKVIPSDMFKVADNYQNSNDIVCKIANFSNNHENVNIIDTGYHGGFPFTTAHYLSSKGYDDALQDLCANILEKELKQ